MIPLLTNTTVTVLDMKRAAIEGLEDLPVFKMPASSEIIATREIPAALAFTFRFKDIYPVNHWTFLKEGDIQYRVVGVRTFETPIGSHMAVDAEMAAGT